MQFLLVLYLHICIDSSSYVKLGISEDVEIKHKISHTSSYIKIIFGSMHCKVNWSFFSFLIKY